MRYEEVCTLLCVCMLNGLKAPSCLFNSSLKQSHTVRISQVNWRGGPSLLLVILFCLTCLKPEHSDKSQLSYIAELTRAMMLGKLLLLVQFPSQWKELWRNNPFCYMRLMLKEQTRLFRWFLSNISTPLLHICCSAVKWTLFTTGSNLFFSPGPLQGSNTSKMISPCDHC